MSLTGGQTNKQIDQTAVRLQFHPGGHKERTEMRSEMKSEMKSENKEATNFQGGARTALIT